MSELSASDATLQIEASRGGPPPQVLEQMAAAGGVAEGLREAGYELRFAAPPPGARVAVELREIDGSRIRVVSLSEAFDIAAGKASGALG
jgi:hypothetical protein